MLGQPLPWDLYTATGVLVLRAGYDLSDPAQMRSLRERPLFRPTGDETDEGHPGQAIHALIQDLDAVLQDSDTKDLADSLRRAATTLIALHRADPDAALGLARLIENRARATRHCVLCALVGLSVGEQMEMTDESLDELVCSALSMNIAAMKLHNELIDRQRLDAQERADIAEHPGRAVNLLHAHGITDRAWLDTVFQHHENMDGSGYPVGLRGADICLPARILRVADLYCAKISGRYYRPPRSSLFAMQYLFGPERRKIDTQIASQLLRRYGFFPPGTLVTLSNRETAVVTRVQARRQALRHVVSVLDARERVLEHPAERDTRKQGFAVARLAEPRPDWPEIHWEAAWGYA